MFHFLDDKADSSFSSIDLHSILEEFELKSFVEDETIFVKDIETDSKSYKFTAYDWKSTTTLAQSEGNSRIKLLIIDFFRRIIKFSFFKVALSHFKSELTKLNVLFDQENG